MSTDARIHNVSDTAFWVANYRTNETDRPDALFRDPLARKLAGIHGRNIAGSMPGSRMMEWSVVLRTVVIDEFITRSIASGTDLILNLGAGLDARPYRMALPSALRWVEVDFAPIIEYKQGKLANEIARCNLEHVSLDLTNREKRRKFLSSVNGSAKKILVLTEGVVPYLSLEEAGSLATDLRSNVRFGGWIVDYFSSQLIKMGNGRGMQQRLQNAPFRFDPPNWPKFFRNHGWRVAEMRYLWDESVRCRRAIPLPAIARAFYAIRSRFGSKSVLAEFMQFIGYALMEQE
ncbi:MAG: SAM-dependent methyltransferase [Gemmatimonadota bacterium]|nr:SAM-dependent methyltransferase [Gemmatimonadota bacterium]